MNIDNFDKDEKRKAMWLGSITGDAFVLGGHWIYDLKKLESAFPDYDRPQQPLPDSYHKNKKLGDQTHYGDQTRHLWEYLAENQGVYDPDKYRKEWMKFIAEFNGYMDGASRESLTALKNNIQFGSSSDELGGTARLAAVYYWMEDSEQALAAAIDQSRMTHDSQKATAITVLISLALEILLAESGSESSSTVWDALDQSRIKMVAENKFEMKQISDSFEAARVQNDLSARSIARNLGQSCHAHHALPAIMAILKQTEDYKSAMKLNVMVGGDSASRAMIIGALLGAKSGMDCIPQDWLTVLRD